MSVALFCATFASPAVHPLRGLVGTRSNCVHLVWLLVVLLIAAGPSKSASFYGLSYIKLPLQDTKNSTDVDFRFKTHQLNAFLFLAAGSSDYCLVFLENGQLAVKLNFGYGETYLASDGLHLSDLSWHKVKLKLAKSHLSLTIDEKHSFLQPIKGNSFELHIKYGIFLGGQDNFKSLYLGKLRPLRGCLEEVHFNQKNVLQAANKHGIMHNVDPECDEQFTAGSNSTISFVDSNSFVIFPSLSDAVSKNFTKLSIHFELRTISQIAILLFSHSSNPYRRQYIAVELIDGKVQFCMKDGTTEYTVQSSLVVNDGQWHQVEVKASETHLQVVVDGRVDSKHTNSKKFFMAQQYTSEILLGGLSTSKQSLALNYGLKSVLVEQNVSLKGCLRNVHINSKLVSLLDALATKQIKTGKCKWHFLCLDADKSPCSEASQCNQQAINEVKCSCSSNKCVKTHFKHKNVLVKSEKVPQCTGHFRKLRLLEGSSTLIGKEMLADTLLHPTVESIHLEMLQMAKHGVLETVSDTGSSTLLQPRQLFDLKESSLQYKHDGSEQYNDTVVLRLIMPNGSNNLETSGPVCDKTITFLIEIESSNDAPNRSRNVITMRMAKNSKKILSYSLFKSVLRELKVKPKKEESFKFSVHHMSNAGASYFEKMNKPPAAVNDFSESDIKSQSIRFVHVVNNAVVTSNPTEVTLHIHAGQSDKVERELRLLVDTYEIELMQVSNTGLLMAYNTVAAISSANLSYSIGNDTDQSQLIKYELVSGPKHGVIQKLRSSAKQWANATQFSQRQVNRGKVRYLHLGDKVRQDKVQLKVSFNRQMSTPVSMVISFVEQLRLVSLGSNRCNLSEQDREVLLDSSKLSYITEPVRTPSDEILVTLLSVPSCAELYLSKINGKPAKLRISSTFSQRDVEESKLWFERNRSQQCVSVHEDLFDFEVAVLGSNATQVATFALYVGQSNQRYVLVNNKISVLEGENVTIDKNHLFFTTEEDHILFHISKQPKHGSLRLRLHEKQQEGNVAPSTFSREDIDQKKLVYVHDDSENDVDSFEFAVYNSTKQTIASGKMFIEVIMKNDNSPIRVVDKPFNVIRNGEKVLSGTDIRYVDVDINTSASNIIYTKNYIPNGNLYYMNDTVAQRFSQEDLDLGQIKYRHNGSDLAKAVLWVTDGQFYLSGVLEIRASEPYIKLVNNTGMAVKYGENGVINTSYLSIETNLDLSNKSKVLFKLISEPKFGQLLVNERVANRFTLAELECEMVEYESTVFDDELPLSKNDSFTFRIFITANTLQEGRVMETHEFAIRIYPQSYFTISLVHQGNLTVFEEKAVTLDSSILLAEHSELKPEQIVYRITQKPQYGLIKNSKLDNLSYMAKRNGQKLSFSQKEINEGHIVYQNVRLDADLYGQYWDSFHFDVGNEVVSLQNQTFYIEVIPKLITISTSNVSVEEGEAAVLTEENLLISHPYYVKLVSEFIVVEEPKYGNIFYRTPGGMQLSAKSFTVAQLKEGKISYKQDSSEVDRDWFTIVARSSALEKESLPATIHISIRSINDESPKIVNNSEAYVWKGSSVQISKSNLAAEDADTGEQEILYSTYLVTNGYLINMESNTTVDSFSQDDLNSGRIYFVHVGTGDASFTFHVTDGKNSGVTSVFHVKERQRTMKVLVNEKLFVVPGMVQSITRRHLQVQANDHTDGTEREYHFEVVKAPLYGKLVLEGSRQPEEKVSRFTQKQIDQNLLLYEQTALISEREVLDRIVLSVHCDGLPSLEGVHFLVEIAVEGLKTATNLNALVQLAPVTVEEGKFSVISARVINLTKLMADTPSTEKVCFKITRAPTHGLVLKSGVRAVPGQCIGLSAFNNGSLVYMHDHSNTFNDSVQFNVMLANGVSISILNITVPIQILPVNDEYPIVLNRNPSMKAVLGSKTEVSNQILNSRDNDQLPAGLIYQIRRDSNTSRESYFLVQPRDVPVYEFTQEDIDSHRVFFNHRGQEKQLTYWFRVKDHFSVQCSEEETLVNFYSDNQVVSSEAHCTPYYPLRVSVAQLSLQLLNHSTIQLAQTTFQVAITRSNLATSSKSASPNFIIYKITKGPFHGYVSVEGQSSQSEFSQKQVDEQLVHYVQTNMSAQDYFLVDIMQYENLYNEKPIYDVNVQISTKPLIKALKPFLVASPGQLSLLSYDYLDASELAMKTNSNPIFKILTLPRYGYFKMLNFGERQGQAENLRQSEFTQEDIIRNRIVYVAEQSNAGLDFGNEMLIDVIHYELSASKAQSAHGVLVVNILSNRTYVELETLVSSDSYLNTLDLKLSKQMLLITCTITVCLVLVVCLVVILRTCPCRAHPDACPQPAKSLSHNDNLQHDQREPHYSSNSLPQVDCSSHTSSNSALACSQLNYQLPHISPIAANKSHSISRTLLEENIECASDLMPKMRLNGALSDKSEDISPLPPPSLYFINDGSFEDHTVWGKPVKRYDQSEIFAKYRTMKEQTNRSSGDGESHSNPSSHSPATLKSKTIDQFGQLDDYMTKNDHMPRGEAFCTLNKMHQLKSSHSQIRNQYWI